MADPGTSPVPTSPARPPAVLATLSLAVFAAPILVRALSSDLFLDGTTYAAISRNLSVGRGTFWAPIYAMPFRQHPPLALWLESLPFRLVGDRPWVEFWWSVLLAAATVGALLFLWDAAHAPSGPTARRLAARLRWWPVLLLGVTPLFSWCVANNLLENTLTPLALLSAGLAVRALGAARPGASWGFALASGIAAFLAFLTKGPPALFVLATPACGLLLGPRARGALRVAAGMLVGIAAAVALTRAWGGTAASDFARAYLRDQLLPSVGGLREVAATRTLVLRVLLLNAILPAIVASAALLPRVVGRRGAIPPPPPQALFFLALAACGSLPFLLLQKQMDWYAVPALPLLAMAFAALTRAGAAEVVQRVAWSRPLRLACGLAAAGLLGAGLVAAGPFARTLDVELEVAVRDAWLKARTGRLPDDRQSEYAWRQFRRDVLAQGVPFPKGARVSVDAPYSFWRLVAYLQRHLAADAVPRLGEPWVLVEADAAPFAAGCEPLQRLPPARLFAYRCSR